MEVCKTSQGCGAVSIGILLLMLVILPAFAADNLTTVIEEIRLKFPGVTQIAPEQLQVWMNSTDRPRPVILDIRAKSEFEISHLSGAILAPGKRDIKRLLKDIGQQTPVVVYCSVGYRSSKMASWLQKKGYDRVYNLEGSIFAWVEHDYPVYRNGLPVKEVHPYDKKWKKYLRTDYLPETFRMD